METTPSTRSPARGLRPDDGRLLRGRKSRAQIREAARALFRENGFDGATLRAIAERAGMGASSIYRHIREQGGAPGRRARASSRSARGAQSAQRDDRAPPRATACARFLDARARAARRGPRPHHDRACAPRPTPARAWRARCWRSRTARIGLLTEILQTGRAARRARAATPTCSPPRARIVFFTSGARIAWANGLLDAEGCRSRDRRGRGPPVRGHRARPRSLPLRTGRSPMPEAEAPGPAHAPRAGAAREARRDRRPAGRPRRCAGATPSSSARANRLANRAARARRAARATA